MRAVVLKGFGGLEMLEERDLPVPEPGPGEVLVRNPPSSWATTPPASWPRWAPG